MENISSCSGAFGELTISESNDFAEQLMRGIILRTFECGEVSAIIFRKYQDPLYVVPREVISQIKAELKCSDEVSFKVDKSNVVFHIEEGTGGVYFTNFISGNMVTTVAILSKEKPRQAWTPDFGMLSAVGKLQDLMKKAAPNVPFNARLEWKIELGEDDPALFELKSFKPTISFSLLKLGSVNVGRLNCVSRAPWNTNLKPAAAVKQPIEDEGDAYLAVSGGSKVKKGVACFVINPTRMYCPVRNEYVLIARPMMNIRIGSSVSANAYWCVWNSSLVAVKIKPVGSVNTRLSSNNRMMYSVEVDARCYGLYRTIQVGLVSDPLCKLQRLHLTEPFSVWVKHSNAPGVYPPFSIVDFVDIVSAAPIDIVEITSSGFIKDVDGSVHVPNYPSLKFQLAEVLMEKFTVGQFLEFTAEFHDDMHLFLISAAVLDLQPTHLAVGNIELIKDESEVLAFRASFTAAIGPLLENGSIGFVLDKYGHLKKPSDGSLLLWVVFKRKENHVVPLRVLSPKDVKRVKMVSTGLKCCPSLFQRKCQRSQIPERAFTLEMYEEMDKFLDARMRSGHLI